MRNHRKPQRERGIAMIAILALVTLIGVYLLVTQLRTSTEFVAERRNHNAQVLNQAKQALIGYVAQQAAIGDNPGTTTQVEGENPGHLPCPEAPANFGTNNEGIAAGNCTLPAVGRLPWRTLGLDKLLDAASEPLWYVVSPGWALSNSTTPPLTTFINSDTPGQLTVDGVASNSVALIIAPGPAFTVPAASGCGAWTQVRATSGAPDRRNYLECENATSPADVNFVTTGPAASFNDQVLRVTTADLMPEIEAAIAERIRREIVPVLKGVYASAQWGLTSNNPMFPFASPFANPGPGTGTGMSNYRGEYDTTEPSLCPNILSRCQGLLPLTYNSASCGGSDPRCSTGFVSWNTSVNPTIAASNGVILDASCGFSSGNPRCDGHYAGLVGQTVELRMTTRAKNVAMALKSLDSTGTTTSVRYGVSSLGSPVPGTGASGTFNSDGSANVTAIASVPGFDNSLPLNVSVQFRITASIDMVIDHPFLNATADPAVGWFWRNEWYRLLYYAPALGHTAAGVPTPSCTTGVSCLSVTNVAPANKQRAILILTGRSLTNPAGRPNGTLANYLEFGNADGNTTFEQQRISTVINAALKSPFNDRIIVLDANP